MRWFRSIRRFGAALGLFALLLQLALTFAHIHPDDLFPSASGAAAQIADGSQAGGRDPERQAPSAPHDDCPICSVMHLAGTVVLPAAPALAAPVQFTTAHFAAAEFVPPFIPRRLPFETRAPPTA
jgi:hypothetical protein